MFQKYCANKNETQKQLIHKEFKKLRNNVISSIRKSKNEYFKLCFDKNCHNLTLIGKEFSSLLHYCKVKSKVHPNIAKVKDKDIMNPTHITNAFNNFFIDIDPNLSKTIPD